MLATLGTFGEARAHYVCTGAINTVAADNWGQLFVRHGGRGYWFLCNVQADGAFGGVQISAATCRSWQAILMAAQKTGSPVQLHIQSASTNAADCGTQGNWVSPGVYFVEDYGG